MVSFCTLYSTATSHQITQTYLLSPFIIFYCPFFLPHRWKIPQPNDYSLTSIYYPLLTTYCLHYYWRYYHFLSMTTLTIHNFFFHFANYSMTLLSLCLCWDGIMMSCVWGSFWGGFMLSRLRRRLSCSSNGCCWYYWAYCY